MAEYKEIEIYIPPDLNKRLEEEQDMLERYFNQPGQYPILHKNYEPCFEHEVKLNGNYKLRVYANSEYPDRLPDLVVCESPEPMPDSLDWSGSHDTHTWPPKHGFLRICHWHWAAWTRENMIYQVFNKGEEWLEAYEKYLVTKELPLELEQMELTEEEKVKVQIVQQRQIVQFQQHAVLALCQLHPNFLNELHRWHMHAIIKEILSQRNLPIFQISPIITVDEIRNTQRGLLESAIQRVHEHPNGIMFVELFRLQCAITECRLANPECDVDVSCTETDNGSIGFNVKPNVKPIGPRSIQNS